MLTKNQIHLISSITTAFKDVKLEDAIGLTEAVAIDDYKDPACADLQSVLFKFKSLLYLHQTS